jgi:hypothetical protein
MKREEAIALIKDMVVSCEDLGVLGIMLMLSSAVVARSQGYQVHIKTEGDEHTFVCIARVAKKHNLVVCIKREEDLIVIYQPLPERP